MSDELNHSNVWRILAIVFFAFSVFLFFFDVPTLDSNVQVSEQVPVRLTDLLPEEGFELSVQWGDMGRQLVGSGVIDEDQMGSLYKTRGGLSDEQFALLYDDNDDNLRIDSSNAGLLLNLFWALGLANQSSILEEGPMQNYGDAGGFASTGGWTLSVGDSMDHYSRHSFLPLSDEQTNLVLEVAENIHRPCCNNPTHFPDCNHGMAMLGFLELLVFQGASEEELYEQALQLNTYWFPTNYLNIAQYFQEKGIAWTDVDPKEVLGADYSSASGYRNVLASIEPRSSSGGGGCSV